MLAAIDAGSVGVIAAALLGAGGVSGVFNLLRIRRENERLGAQTDQIAADTLIKVNEELRRELKRRDEVLEERTQELRDELAERDRQLEALRQKYNALRRDFDALEIEFRRVEKRNGSQ